MRQVDVYVDLLLEKMNPCAVPGEMESLTVLAMEA